MIYSNKNIEIADPFEKHWALASSGTISNYTGCTIGWGNFGTLWGKRVVTIYIHPGRFTIENLKKEDRFTVSFFTEEYKDALSYMGSKSGRTEDKVKNAGLSLEETENGVIYKEACLTFICKKLYEASFHKDALPEAIQAMYQKNPAVYPPDENGDWVPHMMFIGEIETVIEKE